VTEPQAAAGGRRIPLPSGRGLGGGSSVNTLTVTVRLRSADPADPPVVDPADLADETDRKALRQGTGAGLTTASRAAHPAGPDRVPG
jgi:hypothetical protein